MARVGTGERVKHTLAEGERREGLRRSEGGTSSEGTTPGFDRVARPLPLLDLDSLCVLRMVVFITIYFTVVVVVIGIFRILGTSDIDGYCCHI